MKKFNQAIEEFLLDNFNEVPIPYLNKKDTIEELRKEIDKDVNMLKKFKGNERKFKKLFTLYFIDKKYYEDFLNTIHNNIHDLKDETNKNELLKILYKIDSNKINIDINLNYDTLLNPELIKAIAYKDGKLSLDVLEEKVNELGLIIPEKLLDKLVKDNDIHTIDISGDTVKTFDLSSYSENVIINTMKKMNYGYHIIHTKNDSKIYNILNNKDNLLEILGNGRYKNLSYGHTSALYERLDDKIRNDKDIILKSFKNGLDYKDLEPDVIDLHKEELIYGYLKTGRTNLDTDNLYYYFPDELKTDKFSLELIKSGLIGPEFKNSLTSNEKLEFLKLLKRDDVLLDDKVFIFKVCVSEEDRNDIDIMKDYLKDNPYLIEGTGDKIKESVIICEMIIENMKNDKNIENNYTINTKALKNMSPDAFKNCTLEDLCEVCSYEAPEILNKIKDDVSIEREINNHLFIKMYEKAPTETIVAIENFEDCFEIGLKEVLNNDTLIDKIEKENLTSVLSYYSNYIDNPMKYMNSIIKEHKLDDYITTYSNSEKLIEYIDKVNIDDKFKEKILKESLYEHPENLNIIYSRGLVDYDDFKKYIEVFPESLKNIYNDDIILEVITNKPQCFNKIDNELKNDEGFLLIALEIQPKIALYIEDNEVIKSLLTYDKDLLKDLSPMMKNDIEIVRESIRLNPSSIKYASDRIKDNPELLNKKEIEKAKEIIKQKKVKVNQGFSL